MRKFYGKDDTLRRQSRISRSKFYSGRIKATRGIASLDSPGNKAISHRIVRRKLNKETQQELKDL